MLTFDRDRIRLRVDRRFGGSPAAVARAWPTTDSPDRSTIGRWLSAETLPQSSEMVLGLAGALDLDPTALWCVPSESYRALAQRIGQLAVDGHTSKLAPAAFLLDFIQPRIAWPPAIAQTYYHRDWFLHRAHHPATEFRNYYSRIAIGSQTQDVRSDFDQTWHFAWRNPTYKSFWQPYGLVRLTDGTLRLYAYSGLTDMAAMQDDARDFIVETWFGEGPAEFRIASLHQFSCNLVANDAVTKLAQVRFGFLRPG
jgi:hypothetical protein